MKNLLIAFFGSAQEALNQIVEVNEISYRVIGVYASKEAKAAKAFGVGGLPIRPIHLLRLILTQMRFQILFFVSMIPA